MQHHGRKIGDGVHIDGGRAGDSDCTFYQCSECGSVWLKVQDSGGLGGKETYYHSLIRTFFGN